MNGLSKSGTLDLLDAHGMNTAARVVLKRPYKPEALVRLLVEFPHTIVSMRTWQKGRTLCPFYPNKPTDELLQIINRDWPKIKLTDEIILSQGINPDHSHMAGKVMDHENEILIEYFTGPGTVRKLDTIQPLVKKFPKRYIVVKGRQYGQTMINQELVLWAPLYMASKAFFRSYPGTVIEWSYYPYKIGKKQENYIYWEVL